MNARSGLWLAPLVIGACSASIAPAPRGEVHAQSVTAGGPFSDRAGIGLQDTSANTPASIDPRRSLAVTDDAILASFSFQAVMDQLVAQAGAPGLTSLQLFQQWWSTAQTCPPPDPTISRYAYQCPRAEGQQATQDPFASPPTDASYVPIGLFNRFDLASTDGSDCGEYRIVFARKSGFSNATQRLLVIFEASLPNPNPSQGLQGCKPVAQFWANLSLVNDVNQRAAQLQNFYFNGLPGFEPVVHIDHYGANGKGQIRANMFLQSNWMLREFKLQKTSCSGTTCGLQIVPSTVKVNPFGALFSGSSTLPEKQAFDDALVAAVQSLAVNDINTFTWAPDDSLNAAQSDEQNSENLYSSSFNNPATSTLRTNLTNKLASMGSTLTADNIVARVQALSCSGCHSQSNFADIGNGLTWPASLGFTHVAEQTETGPDGPRHVISPALTNVFLPHRAAVLGNFVGCQPVTCAQLGGSCGTFPDGCGGTVNCGCRAGWSCDNGTCTAPPRRCAPGLVNCDGACVKPNMCF